MSNPGCVYRTDDPEIVKAVIEEREATRAFVLACDEFAEHHAGQGKLPFYSRRFGGGVQVVAIQTPDAGIPAGWKEHGPQTMTPRANTKIGRLARDEMEALNKDGRSTLDAIGMPTLRHLGSYLYSSSLRLINDDSMVEAAWDKPFTNDEEQPDERWQVVPLSQWHAEQEASGDPS